MHLLWGPGKVNSMWGRLRVGSSIPSSTEGPPQLSVDQWSIAQSLALTLKKETIEFRYVHVPCLPVYAATITLPVPPFMFAATKHTVSLRLFYNLQAYCASLWVCNHQECVPPVCKRKASRLFNYLICNPFFQRNSVTTSYILSFYLRFSTSYIVMPRLTQC